MKKDDIGTNAGLVWRTLFYKGNKAHLMSCYKTLD